MIAWYVHGWAFGPSLWESLAVRLRDLEPRIADLGYFGAANALPPDEPAIWITQSFGTMRALANMTPQCRALVAINGFDRFASADGFPGVPVRVLDRMIAAFDADPARVVSDFRRRCGMGADVTSLNLSTLRRDLLALRDMDCRQQSAALSVPVLSLQGGADPILPLAMRAAVLPDARHEVLADAGHLLPLEEPAWCAARIVEFVAGLAA